MGRKKFVMDRKKVVMGRKRVVMIPKGHRTKGPLTTYVRVRTIKQKNFMLLVTETNHGLAFDRDVKVSFETFYDVIFVAMVTKIPQKSVF